MNLPDFTNFQPLNRLREKMKASLPADFSLQHIFRAIEVGERKKLEGTGLEIESLQDIEVFKDGTLTYKNETRVLLYIRDWKSIKSWPTFHISDCQALQKMKLNNRFDRYVIKSNTDSQFIVQRPDITEMISKKLDICGFCLEFISLKNFKTLSSEEKSQLKRNFSIEEFFKRYPRDLFSSHPNYTSFNAPLNKYSKNWNLISRDYRRSKKFICENCLYDLSAPAAQRFLDTHHKNGQRSNNSLQNLQALCIECHAEQYNHSHIKYTRRYREFQTFKANEFKSSKAQMLG